MLDSLSDWFRVAFRPEITSLLESAQRASSAGRVRTASVTYQTALDDYPEHSLQLNFNIGCVCEQLLADGIQARKAYQAAVDSKAGRMPIHGFPPVYIVEANTLENLMLLSLSFDEYEDWAARLERFNSQVKILHVQRAWVRKMYKRGLPWWRVLDRFCVNYSDLTDSSSDAGQYSKAAATYGLILAHRQVFRVPRVEFHQRVLRYGINILAACEGYRTRMGSTSRFQLQRELQPITEPAIAFIDDFAREFRSDPKLQRIQRELIGRFA